MKKILLKSDLFKGISDKEIEKIIESKLRIETFNKGEYLFMKGEKPKKMFILLTGEVTVFREDMAGNRELLRLFKEPGVLFGEVYLYLNKDSYDFSCICDENTKVVTINRSFFKEMLADDEGGQIIENYLHILSKKAFMLNEKIRVISGNSLRQKISRYLLLNQEDNIVKLNYTREEFAEYLSSTRPSVSRELNNMRREGLIEIDRGIIKIVDLSSLEENY